MPPARIHPARVRSFWSKVNQDGPIPDYAPELGPCWLWTAADNGHGYGQFWPGVAHVFSWILENGAVPDGLELDHLCRVRLCVRPSHLEPVTRQVNMDRIPAFARFDIGTLNRTKDTCPQGHPYDEANTYHTRGGRRHCRECDRQKKRRAYAARKG